MFDASELILARNSDSTRFSLVPDGDAFSLCGLPLVGRDVCELHGPVAPLQTVFRGTILLTGSFTFSGVSLDVATLHIHHLLLAHMHVHVPLVFLFGFIATSGRDAQPRS